MTEPLGVAIIGAGIGAYHLAGYDALPDRYQVRTLCDIDLGRARSVVGDRQDITLERDVDHVLADPRIDLVDICLPPHLHFATSMAALRAGKHVVCEKPLVSSLQEADRLADEARASGRTLAPVFQYRYGPAMAQLQALIENGLAGKPLAASIETHWNRQADYYQVPWRGTWKGEQGGAVLGHAIHNHDLLCTILGPVRRLSAMVATRVNPIEVEDCGAISFEMESGAIAASSITLGAASDTTRLRFCFEHLTAESGTAPYAPAEETWSFVARGAADQQAIDACVAGVGAVNSGYAGFFEALSDALRGTGGREVTLADGRRSLELVSAIYQAAREGVIVDLPMPDTSAYYKGWLPDGS